MKEYQIPEGFLLGTATAATHIEGGDLAHNWYRWSDLGRIADGSHCKRACDHIHRIDSDVELIDQLYVDTYRMGLEWVRIEPEEGVFSEEGIAMYRREIELLVERGIRPLVTLWHFSNPLWMEDDGGWENPQSVDRYMRYTQYVVRALGDRVTDWITLNEPNVYLTLGYFEGIWPPGRSGAIRSYFRAANYFCEAHIRAYSWIHQYQRERGRKAQVGVAHHLRIFDGLDDRRLTRWAVRLSDRLFQNIFLEATTRGIFMRPLRRRRSLEGGIYADFIGINYYTRDMIRGVMNPLQLFSERSVAKDSEINDLGWEIYPEGLRRITHRIYDTYKLPIYITENGTCDAADRFRPRYITDHLVAMLEAMDQGVDIRRYYHWSLLDNFEWAEGESARFGLYHTDYDTQERRLRASGQLYSDICRDRRFNR